ncbi:hypothetical protein AMTRI_Chr13g115220 [Amborella trichopoda]
MYVQGENQDIETIEMPLSPHSTSDPKRKTTSSVWEGDILKADCKHCFKELVEASKHGTSHMKEHKKTCLERVCLDAGKQLFFEERLNLC